MAKKKELVKQTPNDIIQDRATEIEKMSDDDLKDRPGIIATRHDPDLVEKWRPVLESYGITDEYKMKWMAQCCETQLRHEKKMRRSGVSTIPTEVAQLIQPQIDTTPNEVTQLVRQPIEAKQRLSTRLSIKIVNAIKRLLGKKIKLLDWINRRPHHQVRP